MLVLPVMQVLALLAAEQVAPVTLALRAQRAIPVPLAQAQQTAVQATQALRA